LENVIQAIASGILLGALYALIAYGLGLIMGIMKFLNIAHGSFLILGGYVSFWLFTLWGIDPYLSIPLVIMATFLMGLILYKLTLSPLLKLPDIDMRISNSLLITFGVIYVLDNAMTLIWTPNSRSIMTSYTGEAINMFGVKLSIVGLCGLGIAILVAVALYFILSKTYFGKHVRAATQDAEAASLCGVNVRRTYLISCGIAVALAGVAGVVVVSSYSITPTSGLSWLLIGIVVMVLAGEGNINAILPAGIVLGLVESASIFIVGAPYRQAVALVVFIIVLMFRPQGLFAGRKQKSI
jgi:branched-chain amino acid transport system permease protein